MLRLSNRGRYALRAVFDLALHPERPAQVRDIATRQRIPLRFLEQIFQLLKRDRLVASKRGPRGGFVLGRTPDEIKLGDVLRAVEGPVVFAEARPHAASPRETGDPRDVTDAVLGELSHAVEQCFDGITLQDLLCRGERVAIAARDEAREPSTGRVLSYVI